MRLLCLLLILFGTQLLFAQQPDSLQLLDPLSDTSIEADSSKLFGKLGGAKMRKDSLPLTKKKKGRIKNLFNFKKNYPNPKKAVILSAILPGAGQIYNKKYWKLPIVYGGLGAMGYFVWFNATEQKRFQKALELRLDGDDTTFDEFTQVVNGIAVQELLDENGIRSLRNEHRKYKELSYIGLVFTYILTGVDTYVDAHLMNFNVNDDLSLQVSPDFKFSPSQGTSMGIGVGLSFRDKTEVELPLEVFEGR